MNGPPAEDEVIEEVEEAEDDEESDEDTDGEELEDEELVEYETATTLVWATVGLSRVSFHNHCLAYVLELMCIVQDVVVI